MKTNKRPSDGHRPSPSPKKGFALIVTLTLMILLTVIAVGLLSLSSISLRSSATQNAQATARANARMAMILAVGELQKMTGPDQRVTMTSSLLASGTSANPNWTGATDVSPTALTPDPKTAPVKWLVSGNNPNPATALTKSNQLNQGNALKLGSFNISPTASSELLAPLVNVSRGNNEGRFAWWIGDEGTKARVDVEKPTTAPVAERDRLTQSQSPLEGGFEKLGDAWSAFVSTPGGTIDKSALISMQTTSLAADSKTLASEFFNDVTTGGYGLPVNVAAGGMKADLSLIFDKSQISRKYGERYFGATPSAGKVGEASIYTFSTKDPSRFYLSNTISQNGSVPTGPNWGILWNYATLWQNVSNQQAPTVGVNPRLESDMRFKTWFPYTNNDQGNFRRDVQHTNNPLAPVLSMFQISFRLSSEKVASPAGAPGLSQYRAQITMQPLMGVWNPHNVAIRAAPYTFLWALYPYFRLNYGKPAGNGKFVDTRFTELWLRDEWTTGTGTIPTPESPTAGRYFSLGTEAVDLQPGEFRLFSMLDKIPISAGDTYKLKPGWSENGGFVINLKAADGSDRMIPEGYRAWFGDIVFQDTQSSVTYTRFPGLDPAKNTSSWFALSTTGGYTLRTADLWNSESGAKIKMPEPIISGWNGSSTSKTTYLIEDLVGDSVAAHIGTWSFFSRTTNQAEEVDQRLRGWVDSNPRALISNPLWDGSKVDSSGQRTGWNTSSQWIGAYNPPGRPKVVGDGEGGNRGLLAEGGSGIPEPEVNVSARRYQGFGGAANTLAGGRTNVIAFDVPRSPLVSLGQFQHAQLSRYNFEPGFVVGNSYANPRIPLGETTKTSLGGLRGLNVTDVSHELNQKLWDGYFFSTLGPDYFGASGASFDKVVDLKKLSSGASTLPNPRMVFAPLQGDTTIDKILADNPERAPEAIASRILVKGAFNVNSTSKTAWKAILSSMGASQLPIINPQNRSASWQNPGGVRFNRFGHVLTDQSYEKGDAGDEDAFWQGWRNLSDAEVDRLAAEIVEEVKARGPFRSMAEFVNRNPKASNTQHQLKGPLQAALDRTVNVGFPSSVGKTASQPTGPQFSAAVTNENVAVGSASYLMQGDVLQSLAPILQVRSDYFKILTCGEALDASGKVIARAWCEAFVQRTGAYVDPQDSSHKNPTELASAANKTFGRRYEIVSFRWLSNSEI